MASAMLKKSSLSTMKTMMGSFQIAASRSFASVSVGTDLVSTAPEVSLQKARTWDEGVESKFSTTPVKDLFKDKKVVIFGLPGAFTGVCSAQHVPSYKTTSISLRPKELILISVVFEHDLGVTDRTKIEFYGDFDGSFHKSLDLGLDLSGALLGPRSQRPVQAHEQASRFSAWSMNKGNSSLCMWPVIACLSGYALSLWSAYVVDGKVKTLNVEKVPSEFKVSGGEVILDQI
ncbi:hypothetical protein IFM89_017507 [Coptis chinensis]|uniref:glutaredoxin-dependent peroxiredoxin n=1 Tax=Coptis chinensis TaxID=261450 RepID=A0A835HY65_9MAGN|nr:hypothetical protein IFM89_017507 [Coptis chinensis]